MIVKADQVGFEFHFKKKYFEMKLDILEVLETLVFSSLTTSKLGLRFPSLRKESFAMSLGSQEPEGGTFPEGGTV